MPAPIRSAASLIALVLALAALGAAPGLGCVSPGDGPSPPADELYYPSGIAVSPGGHSLFIISSDFDLAYNAGTVIAIDLDRVRAMIPPVWDRSDPQFPCASLPANTQSILYPGSCGPIDLKSPVDGKGTLVTATTQIGAFATDALVLVPPGSAPTGTDARARLFVPVRGDPSVTYLEIADDRIEGTRPVLWCGQTGDSPRCAGAYRTGENAAASIRGAVLPNEPYGIAASEDGEALVVTHQTTGTLSLVTNPWAGVPTLEFVLSGFPYGAVGVATIPVPAYVRAQGFAYNPGFLATFRAAPEVDTVRFYDDQAASPARPFISRTGIAPITVNASGLDSRGIVIDSHERKACEQTCDSDLECLRSCASVPMGVFIANRSPPSLVVGELRTTVGDTWADEAVTIFDSVPLPYGPSRVQIGNVVEQDGLPHRRVFVSCFDSRSVIIYDPARFRVDAHVNTGRGPHSLAFDPVRPLAYVGHFTDSYVGAVDLDRRHASYGTIIASIGTPRPPRETK